MEEEIWKDIPGYEGIYQFSNQKRVKSLKRFSRNKRLLQEKILTINDNGKYKSVYININGKMKRFFIDRLYYEIFEKEGE